MAPGGMMPMCDWSEHASPDGKKYFYNAKTQESVWEKPKELEEFEKAQMQGMQQAATTTTSTTSVIPDKVRDQPKQLTASIKTPEASAVSAKLALRCESHMQCRLTDTCKAHLSPTPSHSTG